MRPNGPKEQSQDYEYHPHGTSLVHKPSNRHGSRAGGSPPDLGERRQSFSGSGVSGMRAVGTASAGQVSAAWGLSARLQRVRCQRHEGCRHGFSGSGVSGMRAVGTASAGQVSAA